MADYKCPNCDGPFELPRQSNTVVCPYCSTTIQVKTGEVIKESYIMRVQFNIDQVREKMLSWATKQLGAPKDLEEKAEIKEGKLVYYPKYWRDVYPPKKWRLFGACLTSLQTGE